MIKHFTLVIFLFGLECLPAQSRMDALLNLDPIFSVALDSLRTGHHRAVIAMMNPAKDQFQAEQKWGKLSGSLIIIGKAYFELQQLDSSLLALNEALISAQKISQHRLSAYIQEGLARLYIQKRNYPLAQKHYYEFAKWCFSEGKPKAKVETCLQLIQVYTKAVAPDSIFKYLRLGLTYTKGHDFPVLEYKLTQMAGLIFNNLGQSDSALYYFRQSLEKLENSPGESHMTSVYLKIVHVFLDNQNVQRARHYLSLAQKSAKKYPKAVSSAMLIYYEGRALLAEKNYTAAVSKLEKAIKAFKKLPSPERHQLILSRGLKALAEANHGLGDAEKALSYLRQAKSMNVKVFQRYNEMQNELMEAAILSELDAVATSDELLMENLVWAKKSENLNYQIKLYETPAANARKKQETEKALAFMEKVQELKGQIDPAEQASKLINEELKIEEKNVQRLQVANAYKARNLQKSRLQVGFLVMCLLFLASISWWVYHRKRQLANRLQAEKQQVEASLQEKELLLKEIHHRVKNNMQVISSLLNLQSRSVQDPVALKVMREGRDRVRTMALIHQTLYQNNDFSNVETEDYFRKLAENLFHTYNIDQDRVQLVAHIQPLKFNVDIMIALGLILNELISNTLKYAFPGEQNGEVRISLATHADQVELKVEDNGVGFPANFVPDNSRSIGYSLIQAFTQKLGGSLQLHNAEKGARASLVFPLKNATLAA